MIFLKNIVCLLTERLVILFKRFNMPLAVIASDICKHNLDKVSKVLFTTDLKDKLELAF